MSWSVLWSTLWHLMEIGCYKTVRPPLKYGNALNYTTLLTSWHNLCFHVSNIKFVVIHLQECEKPWKHDVLGWTMIMLNSCAFMPYHKTSSHATLDKNLVACMTTWSVKNDERSLNSMITWWDECILTLKRNSYQQVVTLFVEITYII